MEANHLYLAALLVLCYSAAVFGKLAAPAGPRKLHYDEADSFKVFQSFPNAVAIIDSDNDTSFNCWTADRTEIDHKNQTATYAALFPTVRKTLLFHVKAENNSPKFTFTLNDDPTPKEGMFYYTDYENCVIEDLEYHGHQCVLWVRKELKNSVPQICINHFADTCGVGVLKHGKDLCREN
ncbi:uncharacterized protein [Dermacentor albipictus]|uniref:uncharacterized protein n=1 Tax=Dermacentor albipictus TaxID=60249 RepID=UPI0038FCC066